MTLFYHGENFNKVYGSVSPQGKSQQCTPLYFTTGKIPPRLTTLFYHVENKIPPRYMILFYNGKISKYTTLFYHRKIPRRYTTLFYHGGNPTKVHDSILLLENLNKVQ